MKMDHTNFTSQSQGALAASTFGVNFDSVMAYSFMSGIAKDKIRYPVREIGTNAYDANPDLPFDVNLPTIFDPVFRVRDNGPGLSYDDIMGAYTTFGGSLKRDADDQVGGLGWGSKSPFAYLISRGEGAASFTVRSFFNSEVHTYIMSLAPNGMPECRYFGSAPIDPSTPTGIEVSFVVDKNDINTFHRAVHEIYWHFPTRPNVTPHPLPPSEPIEISATNSWSLYDNSVPFYQPYVRMGCVAYPIDVKRVGFPDFPFAHSPIVFDAPIGSLSFTTSREELGYDVPTIAQLSKLLNQFLEEYAVKVQADIDAAPSYLDACKVFRSLTFKHKAIDVLNQRSLISYKGRRLRSSLTGDKDKFNIMIVYSLNDASPFIPLGVRSNRDDRWEVSLDLLNFKSVVYSTGSSSYPQKRIEKLNPEFPMLWIRTKTIPADDIIDKWDLSSFNPVNLNKVKIDRATSPINPPTVKSLTYLTTSSELKKQKHDMAEGGVYVLSTPRTHRRSRRNYLVPQRVGEYDCQRMRSYLKLETPIWVFEEHPENSVANPNPNSNSNSKNWVLLGDAVLDVLKTRTDIDKAIARQHSGSLDYDQQKWGEMSKHLDTDCVPQDVIDLAAKIAEISNSRNDDVDDDIKFYLSHFPLTHDDRTLRTSIHSEIDALFDKYLLLRPLLAHISRWNVTSNDLNQLNYYFRILKAASPSTPSTPSSN